MEPTGEVPLAMSRINEAEKLIAHQVERVFILKSAKLNADKAETKLAELCSMLAAQRAKFSKLISAVKTKRQSDKLLREGADVGGPRWKIGWARTI